MQKLGKLAKGLENEYYLNLLGPMLAFANYIPTTYDKPIFAIRFRYISKMPWIISLFNVPVEGEPQLASTDA